MSMSRRNSKPSASAHRSASVSRAFECISGSSQLSARYWDSSVCSGHARMDAEPFVASPLVCVHVTAVRAGLPRAARRHDGSVVVHVDDDLVDCQSWSSVTAQVLHVSLVCPHLAGRTVEVREAWGEDRLEQLPRPLGFRFSQEAKNC